MEDKISIPAICFVVVFQITLLCITAVLFLPIISRSLFNNFGEILAFIILIAFSYLWLNLGLKISNKLFPKRKG